MGAPRTAPKVLAAIQKYPNRDMSSEQLAHVSGLTKEQVRSAMRTLIADGKPIQIILRGSTWRYVPEAPAKEETPVDYKFTKVGVLASGEVLVRGDQTDTIYVLSELELGN